MKKEKVLIVGAGPTGLVLALTLNRLGIPVKIIDQESGPGNSSRAMGIVPGTLEHYSQLGIIDEVVDEGIEMKQAILHTGKNKTKIKVGALGEGLSRFPYLLSYPQDEHEQLLVKKLKERGQNVTWETSFEALEQKGSLVEVTMLQGEQTIKDSFSYVVGCDGGSSKVRKELSVDFKGETNENVFFVSDVELKEHNKEMHTVHAHLYHKEILLLFPIRNKKSTRLIGMIPDHLVKKDKVDTEHMIPYLEQNFNVNVRDVNWFSEYKIHHRLADSFRMGQVFLAGDAAHIHSPVGGQGLNAGVADALNLGWKVAKVLQREIDSTVLNTYEEERKTVAEELVKTTDQAFKFVSSDNHILRYMRRRLLPLAGNFAINKYKEIGNKGFKIISQTGIRYEKTELNTDDEKDELIGSRLPYFKENLSTIEELDWHLHVYGNLDPGFHVFVREYGLSLHNFPWKKEMEDVGFKENAAYLIRPDGYISWMSKEQDYQSLAKYIKKWKILPSILSQ